MDIQVEGHGTLEVPDDFEQWDPKRQEALIDQAVKNKPQEPEVQQPQPEQPEQPQQPEGEQDGEGPVLPDEFETKSDDEWINILWDIFVSGGIGGYAGAEEGHSPLAGGQTRIPELTFPEIAWDKVTAAFNGIFEAIKSLDDIARGADRLIRKFVEGIGASVGLKTRMYDLGPGERVPNQEWAKRAHNSIISGNFGIEEINGVYYKEGRKFYDTSIDWAGKLYALFWGPTRAATGMRAFITTLRKIRPSQIGSVLRGLKTKITNWKNTGKIGTATESRALTAKELGEVGKRIKDGFPTATKFPKIRGAVGSIGRRAKTVAQSVGKAIANRLKQELSRTAKGTAWSTAKWGASVGAEYAVANKVVDSIIEELDTRNVLSDEDKSEIAYWYGANWVTNRAIGATLSYLRNTKTFKGKVVDFFIADALTYFGTLAGGGGANTTTLAEGVVKVLQGLASKGAATAQDVAEWVNELELEGSVPVNRAHGGLIGDDPMRQKFYSKGGKIGDKVSKIYNEGYTAPGQAYAIAKSKGYAGGGKVTGSLPMKDKFYRKSGR